MLKDYVYAENYKGNASLWSQLNLTEQDELEYPLAKRRKLTTPKTIVSDVGNLDDFADTMPPLELEQRRIERFLREVFIPSTPYGQFMLTNQNTETMPSYYS